MSIGKMVKDKQLRWMWIWSKLQSRFFLRIYQYRLEGWLLKSMTQCNQFFIPKQISSYQLACQTIFLIITKLKLNWHVNNSTWICPCYWICEWDWGILNCEGTWKLVYCELVLWRIWTKPRSNCLRKNKGESRPNIYTKNSFVFRFFLIDLF